MPVALKIFLHLRESHHLRSTTKRSPSSKTLSTGHQETFGAITRKAHQHHQVGMSKHAEHPHLPTNLYRCITSQRKKYRNSQCRNGTMTKWKRLFTKKKLCNQILSVFLFISYLHLYFFQKKGGNFPRTETQERYASSSKPDSRAFCNS